MPIFEITGPDKRVFDIEAPEGATLEDAIQFAQQEYYTKPYLGQLDNQAQQFDVGDNALIPNSIERGMALGGYAIDHVQHGFGLKNDEDFARDAAKLAAKMKVVDRPEKMQEAMKDIQDFEGVGEFLWDLASNPGTTASLVGESFGAMVPAIVGSASVVYGGGKLKIPKWGLSLLSSAAFGAGSGMTEAGGEFFDGIQQQGVDINNPEAVQEFLSDEAAVRQLRKQAIRKGVPIAAFDALTMGIAGLPFKAMTKGKEFNMALLGAAGTTELGTQALGGALGEYFGQINAYGEVEDKSAIALEAALEFITGGPQAAYNTLTINGLEDPVKSKFRQGFSDAHKKILTPELREKLLGEETIGGFQDELLGEEDAPTKTTKEGQLTLPLEGGKAKKPFSFGVPLEGKKIGLIKKETKKVLDSIKKRQENIEALSKVKKEHATKRQKISLEGKTKLDEDILDLQKEAAKQGFIFDPENTKNPIRVAVGKKGANTLSKILGINVAPPKKGKKISVQEQFDFESVEEAVAPIEKPTKKPISKPEPKKPKEPPKKPKTGLEKRAATIERKIEDLEDKIQTAISENKDPSELESKLDELDEQHEEILADINAKEEEAPKKFVKELTPEQAIEQYHEKLLSGETPAKKKKTPSKALKETKLPEPEQDTLDVPAYVKNLDTNNADSIIDAFARIKAAKAAQEQKGAKIRGDWKPKYNNSVEYLSDLLNKNKINLENPDTAAKFQDRLKVWTAKNGTDPSLIDISQDIKFQKLGRTSNIPKEQFKKSFGKKLKATRLSAVNLKSLENVLKDLESIMRKSGGARIAPTFVADLVYLNEATNEQEALRGAQIANLAIIALNENKNPTETAYHEVWEFLKRNGVFDDKVSKKILKRDLNKYKDFIIEGSPLVHRANFDLLAATQEGRDELEATVFGLIAAEWKRTGKIDKALGIPQGSHNLFRKAWNLMNTLFRAITGNKDVNSMADIFANTVEGKNAVRDIILSDKFYRAQKISAAATVASQVEFTNIDESLREVKTYEEIEETVEAKIKETNVKTSQLGKMHSYVAASMSKIGLSNRAPIFSTVFNTVQQMKETSYKLGEKYHGLALPFFKESRSVRYALSEVMMHNNRKGQKAKILPDGTMTYERDGVTKKVTNKEAVKAYVGMRDAMQETLKDQEAWFRQSVLKTFEDLPQDFAYEDIEALLLDPKVADSEKKQLSNIADIIDAFRQMKQLDYVPKMRFGDYAVAVYEKVKVDKDHPKGLGKLVYFSKVERGGKFDTYNPQQFKALKEDLKTKGYDNQAKFVIRGKENSKGEPTNQSLDSLKLFTSTANQEAKLVDKKMISFEMLAAMLDTSKINEKGIENLRKDLELQVSSKGFSKQFVEAQDVDGYSTDWDRVFNSYLHGTAHNLSHMRHRPRFTSIQNNLEYIDDPVIKDMITKYFDYNANTAEDLQTLRGINFGWTMGFNPSTAALQYFTLPTLSLGSMMQFGGSIPKNMQSLMRWGSYSKDFLKTGAIQFRQGGLVIDITNEKAWERIRKKRQDLSPAQFNRIKDYAIDQFKRGNLGAVMLEESAGPTVTSGVTKAERAKQLAQKGLQYSGMLVAFAEQNTRFATSLAVFEQLTTDPEALAAAQRVYANEDAFLDMSEIQPYSDPAAHAATYTMHRAHALFGKTGRPEIFKGVGGAFIFPFMTWPHQVWGTMNDMATKRGPEGKVGLATTLGMMMLIGGALGLPGAALTKDLFEEFYKNLTGTEIDAVESFHRNFGPRLVTESITNGLFRSIGKIDISNRTGVPVPGENIIMSALGMRTPDAIVGLGVQGSMVHGLFRAVDSLSTEAGAMAAAQDILPTQLSSIVKAMKYHQQGVLTRGEKTQLVGRDDVDIFDIVTRMFGVTSAKIARAREENWFTQVLDRRSRPAVSKYKSRMINNLTRAQQAQADGNKAKADRYFAKYEEALDDIIDYSMDTGIYIPLSDMISSVFHESYFRLNPGLDMSKISKSARVDVMKMKEDK